VVYLNLLFAVFLLFALPAEAGKFKRVKSSGDVSKLQGSLHGTTPVEAERAEFVAGNGERFSVELLRLRGDGAAYELLSLAAAEARTKDPKVEIGAGAGTAAFSTPDQVAFFKGPHFVRVTSLKQVENPTNLNELARAIGETLDKGEGDVPALLKHLPDPDEAQMNAVYLSTFSSLDSLGLQQGVLSAVRGDGNADAAFAKVGASKVLLVEFHTPQLATENDQRIIARIQELWKLGQPAPTAYRRVGNYSVFVFDAPDEQTAKQLIDQVKYEQVVSWLGENPNILREAQERYVNTTLGVLVTVLKASGYALVGCLGFGGLIGALLFTYRRSRQKEVTAYSDAGGMLRLNLDELTTTDLTDRRR
jgi:hypothetical protein